MSEWVKFDGQCIERGDIYRLTAASGRGILEVPKSSVQLKGADVSVAVGATVTVIEAPPAATGRKADDKEAQLMSLTGCRKTQCVGLLLICCDNGAVIGPCIGAWGC